MPGRFLMLRAAVVLLLTVPSALGATPPDATLSSLEGALALLERSDVPTGYVLTTVFTIADGSGKTLQTIEMSEKVTLRPGEPGERETLYRKTTPEDADAVSGASRKGGGSGSSGQSWTMVPPAGEGREFYSFSETATENGLAYSDFAPLPRWKSKEGMVKGRLYWDPVSGNPTKIEMVPVKNPPFTSELIFRFAFSQSNGYTYPSVIAFSGEGGFLLFRRKIDSVSKITDFRREGRETGRK